MTTSKQAKNFQTPFHTKINMHKEYRQTTKLSHLSRRLSDPINSQIYVHHIQQSPSLPPIHQQSPRSNTVTTKKPQIRRQNLSEYKSRNFDTIPADFQCVNKFVIQRQSRKPATQRQEIKGKKKFIEVDILVLQTCYAKNQTVNLRQHKDFKSEAPKDIINIPIKEGISELIKNYKVKNEHIDVDQLVRSDNFAVDYHEKQSLYFGQMKNEEYEGKGVLITKNFVFEGSWLNSQKVQGIQITTKGIYKGKFINGQRSKIGQFYWNNGEYYSGEWYKNKKHGTGLWKSKKGDVYMGHWVKGKVQGYGIHLSKSGQKYQGFFLNFLKQGQGKQYFPNGDYFQGQFKQGKPHGEGIYKWTAGISYEGEFVNGFRQGKGKIKKNDMEYEGHFQKQKANGEGKLTVWNNYSFVGNFKQGKKQGKGVKKQKKRVFIGCWHQNRFIQNLQ